MAKETWSPGCAHSHPVLSPGGSACSQEVWVILQASQNPNPRPCWWERVKARHNGGMFPAYHLGPGAGFIAPFRVPRTHRPGACFMLLAAGSCFPRGGSGQTLASMLDTHVDFYLSSS